MGLVGALKDVVSDLGPDLTQLVFAGDKFVSASDFNVRVDSLLAASAAASSVFAKADISIAKNALPVLAIASLSQATVSLANNAAIAANMTGGQSQKSREAALKDAVGDLLNVASSLASMMGMFARVAPAAGGLGFLLFSASLVWENRTGIEGGARAAWADFNRWFFAPGGRVATWFSDAQRFAPRADPLVLDLDGDGLETVGLNLASPVYFDHNADGIKTGTGWVKSDDAFLVLDRNGNGIIDDGRELFGDATPLNGKGTLDPSAGIAAQGFAALAKEDTNLDGVVNAADARFGALRLWRDFNQDGASQAGELFTLGSQNITGIRVASTEVNRLLPDGNLLNPIHWRYRESASC